MTIEPRPPPLQLVARLRRALGGGAGWGGFALQILFVAALVWIGYEIVANARANLESQRITSGFGFLSNTAGFDVSQNLIPYSGSDSYTRVFWVGLLNTLLVAIIGIFFATVIGFLVGLGRLSKSRLLNIPLIGFIEAFRCTPLLVQIVWFYYALPVLLGIQIPAVAAAVMTLSLYTAAFYAEIFRGGIVSIEQGQWDAARALGLSRWNMMRKVILPQATRRMIPPFVNQSITQLKNTSLVSTIAVPDLLYQGTLITADTYRPLEVYTMIAVIYFFLLFPTTLLAQVYERRLAKA